MKKILLFSCFFLFLCCAMSQGLYPISIDEKISNSSLIIEGKVIAQQSYWNTTHTLIFTDSKIIIYKIFKGAVTGSTIDILTQGGTVDNQSMQASELLELSNEDVGLFFCYPNQNNFKNPVSGQLLWDVYSSAQGCFKYFLNDGSASAPFVRYASVQQQLYPELVQKIGTKYTILNNSFTPLQSSFNQTILAGSPTITNFSPSMVKAGSFTEAADNILTITGSDFGTPTGVAGINFDDPDNGTGGTPFFVPATSDLIVSWTDGSIVVKVPTKAGTGIFSVVDASGNIGSSSSPLRVKYAILTGFFGSSPTYRPYNLINDNGSGGYDYVYSTSTTGSGIDFSTSLQKASFERAITTWKNVAGLHFTYTGTTMSQTVNGLDGVNIIMMDNTNTGVPVLPAGVLGVAYTSVSSCIGGSYAFLNGFDIIIRNAGVSMGSINLNLGPCKTVTSIIEYDLETVMLHELGHALTLGHINDPYIGTFPNIDPGKLMNYAVVNGADRRSPDWSSLSGAHFAINPRGLDYGGCISNNEMIALATTPESKDECPSVFPGVPTIPGASVSFDLGRATSNKNVDPQFTKVNTTGTGTSLTNNAYYAIRTAFPGSLNITVSDYSPIPADVHTTCAGMGIELSLYAVSSCPAGQSYPTPIAYRTFSNNGNLTNIAELAANTTYLVMVDGISNTKAAFNLTFGGTAFPVILEKFTGESLPGYNQITFKSQNSSSFASKIIVEKGSDGQVFSDAKVFDISSFSDMLIERTWNDLQPFADITYYRLKFIAPSGAVTYSNIISVIQSKEAFFVVVNNPATDFIHINWNFSQPNGTFMLKLIDDNGKLLKSKILPSTQGTDRINIKPYAKGLYLIVVTDEQQRIIKRIKVVRQ